MTILALLGLALVDSINPSALLVTIYLLTRHAPSSRIFAYLGTVFTVYLTIGVLLMIGVDALWDAASELLESDTAHAIQGIIGAALLIYAIFAPSQSGSKARQPEPRSLHWAAMIPLGVTVTILEIPTALPYFAAIGIMTAADLPAAQWAPYLLIYNLIFVSPPVTLYIVARTFGSRAEERLPGIGSWLQRTARMTWLWILGIVGFLLLADALSHFEFFGLL